MPIPPSVTKTIKGNVTIVSSVDRCSYTIRELTRAALRDVGKYVCITCNRAAQRLYHGSMQHSKRVRTLKQNFQYWVRSRESDLQVGITHDSWYGVQQELGSSGNRNRGPSNMKKKGILTKAVYDNIAEIIKIESQYLSALEDEAEALALISAAERDGGDEE